MISQSVIMAVLIGIVITGLVPVIGGIVLLATHKIKGTSFWAGVLAYIIAMIVYSIIGGIISAAAMFSTGDMTGASIENSPALSAGLSAILAVCLALSMGICIGSCMKKTRTFKGAVSCGLGFGVSYMITTAIGLVSYYSTFSQINSGAFDKMYAQFVEMGAMDKEMVKTMKAMYTEFTVTDSLAQIIVAIGLTALLVAAAVFIMRGACVKKLFAGMGVSALALAGASAVSAIIPNVLVGTVVAAAIGVAALIFAVRMKEQVVAPENPVVQDSFMQSIENAKE